MTLLSFKAVHLIAMVAWFAGLFYLVRLFVYHAEAFSKEEPARSVLVRQYHIMEVRLYRIITTPAMVLTLLAGIAMLFAVPEYLKEPWIHVKLTLVLILVGYHFYCGNTIAKLQRGVTKTSSQRFRLINELPTVLLIAIILLAVLRGRISMVSLFLIVIATVFILGGATFAYKRYRMRKK